LFSHADITTEGGGSGGDGQLGGAGGVGCFGSGGIAIATLQIN
jgi:hypothetical protein